MPDTVWFERCIEDPDEARFEYDPDNFYWRFCLEAHRRTLEHSRGKFLHQFPDLIEGLDTLAAMRGTERLLVDLIERPEWVHASLRKITDLWFHYYDILYDMIRDEVGGSVFWAWAPGRMVKLQCDISANISPAMFEEFMVPVLVEMTERVGYSMYHWDGPGAIVHLDALLGVPRLTMIQWTPGAGQPNTWDSHWWPLYHRILDAGKKLLISAGTKEHLKALKREFGEKTKEMLINMHVASPEEAAECVSLMEF
jgi:5-methyltetrahydrofolate--homocysteine methyltransferase